MKKKIMNELLNNLIKRKDYWEEIVSKAIQNQYNPYAENGSAKVIECRKELDRINKEIKYLIKSLTDTKRMKKKLTHKDIEQFPHKLLRAKGDIWISLRCFSATLANYECDCKKSVPDSKEGEN